MFQKERVDVDPARLCGFIKNRLLNGSGEDRSIELNGSGESLVQDRISS